MLRPQQRAAIEQMEMTGWEHMTWTAGYTLLHWAGKGGRPDLCAYAFAPRSTAC